MDNYGQNNPHGQQPYDRAEPTPLHRAPDTDDTAPRRMPQRIAEIKLPGEYGLFTVTAWVNFPNSLLDEMQKAAKQARRRVAEKRRAMQEADDDNDGIDLEDEDDDEQSSLAVLLMKVIKGHDFVDFEGMAYPPADDPAFYKAVPNDLLLVTMGAIMAQVGKLPKGTKPR